MPLSGLTLTFRRETNALTRVAYTLTYFFSFPYISEDNLQEMMLAITLYTIPAQFLIVVCDVRHRTAR